MQPRPLGVMEGGGACVRVRVCAHARLCLMYVSVFFIIQTRCFTIKKGDNKNKTIKFDSGSISEPLGGGSSSRISFLSWVSLRRGL